MSSSLNNFLTKEEVENLLKDQIKQEVKADLTKWQKFGSPSQILLMLYYLTVTKIAF